MEKLQISLAAARVNAELTQSQGGESVKTEPITKIPDKLETLYVDAQNKIFLLNGKPIGEGIDYIQINFDGIKWIVTMKCEVTVMKEVSTYNRAGEKIS